MSIRPAPSKMISMAICSLYLFFFQTPVMADYQKKYLAEMSIEELMDISVSSAGFFGMPPEEVPGSIWILSEEDLRTTPAQSLAELVNLRIPGAQVSDHSIFGSLYSSRGVAMIDNATTQFLWDGMNLNSGGSLGVNSGLKLPLLGDIHRIEVSNGPCAVVHGNGSINGFVNMVPKTGATNSGAMGYVGYGLDDHMKKMETSYGHSYGADEDFFVYLGLADSDGISVAGENAGVNGQVPDGFMAKTINHPSYRGSMNWNHGAFHFIGLIQRELFSSDTYYNDNADFPDLYHQTLAFRPGVSIPIGRTESMDLKIPVEFFDSGYIKQYSSGTSERGISDFRAETELIIRSVRWNRHRIATGAKAGYEYYRNNRYYLRSAPDKSSVGDDINWMQYSVFLDDVFNLSGPWTITMGIRYDAIRYNHDKVKSSLKEASKDSEVWSPRFSSAYRILENTILKLSYQEGFHYPPATEIYSKYLLPETVKNFELGLTHETPAGITVTVNGFYNIYQDSLLSEFGGGQLNQRNDFGSTGAEFALEWTDRNSTSAGISYSYSRPIEVSDNKINIYTADPDLSEWYCYPAHMVKGNVSKYWNEKSIMTSFAFEYGSMVSESKKMGAVGREIFENDRYSISFRGKLKIADRMFMNLIVKNIAHNNIPVPTYLYSSPWEGSLGSAASSAYLGFSWE